MRYLVVTALALLSWSWAQQYVSPRQTRVFNRKPQIEAITRNAKWMPIDLDEGLSPGSQPQRRITSTDFGASLGWLKPSQDADTVPTTPNTLPDFAGDTLLANNAGQDIDPNIPSICNYSFFDSVYLRRAWVVYYQDEENEGPIIPYFGNFLHGPFLLSQNDPDIVYYVGGGIAERYDITPRGSTVYIKGIATQILNNYNASLVSLTDACNTSTGETGVPLWEDNVYTIGYQLLDTIEIDYRIGSTLRRGSYPNEVVAEVTKPLSQVRIGYAGNVGQCVQPVTPGGRERLERLDYVYFDTPVEVASDTSYYVAVRYDLYVPGLESINDTLFGLIGPAYRPQNRSNHPCFTADTAYPGRNMVLTPIFKISEDEFIDRDDWSPQYFLFGRSYDLNFLIFPIIYAVRSISDYTPTVRNGSMAFSAPYPNPAVDCLHLNVESPAATTLRLTLYTSEGRLVRSWNRTLQSGTNTVAVDLEVPAGAYLLQAQSAYGTATFWVNVVK